MTRTLRRSFICSTLAIALGTLPAWGWQQTEPQVPDAVSARLASAHKVFISVDSDGLYDQYVQTQITEAVRMWRLYNVAPRDTADLIFELTVDAPREIDLLVRDARTQSELWTFRQHVKGGFVFQLGNFQNAVARLLDQLRVAAGNPAHVISPSPGAGSDPAKFSAVGIPRVFVSATGDDEGAYARWHGQAYNQFYAALQSSGRYELVPAPADADLIFEVHYASPRIITRDQVEAPMSFIDLNYDDPQVKLVIWDRRTRAVARVFTEYIKVAVRQSNTDKNFARAIRNLANDAGNLLGPTPVNVSLLVRAGDAPLPAQISAATRVFISSPQEISDRRICDEIQARIKSWGRYEVVPSPDQADLIFEPIVAGELVRLAILDPKTQVVLWGLTAHVNPRLRGSAYEDALHQAADALMEEVRRLDARAAGTRPTATVSRRWIDAVTADL